MSLLFQFLLKTLSLSFITLSGRIKTFLSNNNSSTLRFSHEMSSQSVSSLIFSALCFLLAAAFRCVCFYTPPLPSDPSLSAACFSEVWKVRLKLNRNSRRRQRRLHFLPGGLAASGEAGCLIRDTTER